MRKWLLLVSPEIVGCLAKVITSTSVIFYSNMKVSYFTLVVVDDLLEEEATEVGVLR